MYLNASLHPQLLSLPPSCPPPKRVGLSRPESLVELGGGDCFRERKKYSELQETPQGSKGIPTLAAGGFPGGGHPAIYSFTLNPSECTLTSAARGPNPPP